MADVDVRSGSDGGALARLDDIRLGASETRAELDLRLGHTLGVIADLSRSSSSTHSASGSTAC